MDNPLVPGIGKKLGNQTVSNSTATPVNPTVTELKTRYESLETRATVIGESIQGLIPLKDRSPEVQEAFLLAFGDLQSFASQYKEAQSGMNGVAVLYSTEDEIKAAGGLVEDLADMAKEMVEAMTEQLGVTEEAIRSTCIKAFVQTLEGLEALLARVEANMAKVTA